MLSSLVRLGSTCCCCCCVAGGGAACCLVAAAAAATGRAAAPAVAFKLPVRLVVLLSLPVLEVFVLRALLPDKPLACRGLAAAVLRAADVDLSTCTGTELQDASQHTVNETALWERDSRVHIEYRDGDNVVM